MLLIKLLIPTRLGTANVEKAIDQKQHQLFQSQGAGFIVHALVTYAQASRTLSIHAIAEQMSN
jgi:hypothetical protein